MLVATRTPDELDTDTLTAADVWAFGCSVLKIFLSHSGPHSQKQVLYKYASNVSFDLLLCDVSVCMYVFVCTHMHVTESCLVWQ